VDDEPPAREELRFLISRHKDFVICGEAEGGLETLEMCERLKPDVLFLDIQLWDLDGVEVARLLLKKPDPPWIIFATAYDSYAVQAFELNAIDYLLKPFTEERVGATLERIVERRNLREKEEKYTCLEKLVQQLALQQRASKLVAWKDERLLVVSPEEIVYAEAQGHQVWLQRVCGDRLKFPGTLQELQERLSPQHFRRVHRSFLVNIDFISEVAPYFHGSYRLLMRDSQRTEIPVGRKYLKNLRETLGF
jgi:two-component system LytT family response regulator/two-component system response regulator LytT